MTPFTGEYEVDHQQSLASVLAASTVQQEVQAIAHQSAEWLRRQPKVSESLDASLGPFLFEREGLCRLCLLPVDVLQMPALEVEPGRQCLVSYFSICIGLHAVHMYAATSCFCQVPSTVVNSHMYSCLCTVTSFACVVAFAHDSTP